MTTVVLPNWKQIMVERRQQASEVGVQGDNSMKQAREWNRAYAMHSLLCRASWSVSGHTYRFLLYHSSCRAF